MGEDKTGKKQRYDGKGHGKKEEKNAVQKKKLGEKLKKRGYLCK